MNSKYKITINKYLAPILVKIYISIFNAYNASVIKAFLIVNQNLSFSCQVKTDTQSSKFFVMQTELRSCFWLDFKKKFHVFTSNECDKYLMLGTVYLCSKRICRWKNQLL